MESVYINADNDLVVTGLSVAATAAYLNSATVTAQLKDSALANITGGDVTLAYVAASNGNYLGALPSTIVITDGQRLWCDLTIVSGSYNDFRRVPCVARYRGAD